MTLLARPHAFERGDKVYLTTPVTLSSPTDSQIEEFAFASAVKSMAPNEHIGWLSGRYVEGGRANLNNAMWLNEELALRSLTPMLMPVTVMHDPRTAVGTIADCKLQSEGSARLDTILAIWKHRFGDTWGEAEDNIANGTLMQSMECLSPSYNCSECGQAYLKLPEGKERASWCSHLQQNSSHRILRDVCFTGTGLIFGSRGGKGAYTEAYLDHFQDEIAEYHERAHIDSTYRSKGSASNMATVTIEQSELDALRNERNDARSKNEELSNENRDLTSKVEAAEAATATEKERADREETARKDFEEKAQRATLKEKRLGELGQGFLSKLGDFTRARLNEQAATLSDEEWESALKEREELAGVKRDNAEASGSGSSGAENNGGGGSEESSESGSAFTDEEVAAFSAKGVSQSAGAPASNGARALARSLSKQRKPVTTGSK